MFHEINAKFMTWAVFNAACMSLEVAVGVYVAPMVPADKAWGQALRLAGHAANLQLLAVANMVSMLDGTPYWLEWLGVVFGGAQGWLTCAALLLWYAGLITMMREFRRSERELGIEKKY